MSLKFILTSCILIGLVSAGLSRKRRGTYEDEAVTPAGGGASVAPMAEVSHYPYVISIPLFPGTCGNRGSRRSRSTNFECREFGIS